MGVERVTIKNLKVVSLDQDKKILTVQGAIPGTNGGKIEIYH